MRIMRLGLVCLLVMCSQWTIAQTPLKLIVTNAEFTAFTAGDIAAFRNSTVQRSFVVRNTSNQVFSGRILFRDVFGSALDLEEITVSYEGGTLPTGVDFNWVGTGTKILSSPLVSGDDHYLDISNLPSSIGLDAGLVFTRRVRVIDCIDNDTKGTSRIFLSVCNPDGTGCQQMTDAWESGDARLVQRINKRVAEFVDIVDYEVRNGGYCAYNSAQNNTDGFRTVSLVAKPHNANDGEVIRRFGFLLSASNGNVAAEVPASRVHIYRAVLNTGGKYVPTGPALAITPSHELNPIYHYRPIYKANPRCVSDALEYAWFEIGDVTANDAYYIEFDVINCQPVIDLQNFNAAWYQDPWDIRWKGLDDCGAIQSVSPNMPQACAQTYDDEELRPTINLAAEYISGSGYGDVVENRLAYTERVTSLFQNGIGNNRLSNSFVANSHSFLGTCYSDGFNYQTDRGKIIIALKLESGLDYYTGTTAGGYFDRLQFRRADGNHWLPTVQLGSTSALYGIPTDEMPDKDYDEIRFFEFDLAALYAMYDPSLTNTSYKKRQLLYEYLNASDLVYSLMADCAAPNKKDLINYSVEMYFVLDATCSNPFIFPSAKITREAKVMCPGCMFPGGAGRGVSIQRTNFGYPDANDNHLADNNSSLTEAQVEAINTDSDPDNNIRTSFGIIGDHIKMKTEYYLTGSEECNGMIWDDLMVGPLTYSYLYISFPKDSIAIDTSVPLKIKIESGGVTYRFEAPVLAIVDLVPGDPKKHIFALDVSTLNTYLASGSPALPSGFRFHSFDEIEYEFELNVLLNSNTGESHQEVFFTHVPYFSSVPLSQYVRDFPQFSCHPVHGPAYEAPPGTWNIIPPPPYTDPFYRNTFLNCEGYEGVFNLVPVVQQVRHNGSYGSSTSLEDPNCIKQKVYSVISSIGKAEDRRIFFGEIREAPYLNEIDVIIPPGYRLKELLNQTAYYNGDLPWYIRDANQSYTNLTPTTTQAITADGLTFTKEHHVFPGPILLLDADESVYPPPVFYPHRVFDEKSHQHITAIYEAVCAELEAFPNTTTLSQATTDQNAMARIYMSDDHMTDWDDYLMTPTIEFLKPFNGLTSSISTTGLVAAVSSNFNVNFSLNNGSTGSFARYPFVTVEYNPADFSNFAVSSTSPHPVQLIESVTLPNGNVKALYSITIEPNHWTTHRFALLNNQSLPLSITGSLQRCFDNQDAPASFKIGYGWDCNGFPTAVADLDEKCFIQEEELKVYSIESGIQSQVQAASQGDRCENPTIHYRHRLVSTGSQINRVIYQFDLPNGLSLNTSSVAIQYGALTLTNADYTLVDISTALNPGAYRLEINPAVLATVPFAGAVIQGNRQEEMILEFDALVAAGCNVYNAVSTTSFYVTAINFCSSILNSNVEVTPDYEACDNTYTVSIEGDQLYCANANIANPITLRAVLPPLGPTVCYTLPMTYEWRILGTTTIIGNTDVLSTTVAGPTTFEVTTIDAAGRIARATYTVDFDYEYQIGSYRYVCGDPNRTFCLPIDAVRTVRNGIIGMDFCLKYDKRYVTPNTVVNNANLGSVVTSGGAFQATYFMTNNASPVIESDPNIGYVHVSIYYTMSTVNNAAQFAGLGRVICVPFTVLGNPAPGQGFNFEMCEMYESYTLNERPVCWGPGRFDVGYSDNMRLQLTYYQAPFVSLNQAVGSFPYYVQNRINTYNDCSDPVLGTYSSDNNGGFNFPVVGANTFSITRDIHNDFTTPYAWYFRNFVNAADTRAMEFIAAMNHTSPFAPVGSSLPFTPTAGQMIAADVNMSDSVRSNDITLTQKRMLGLIREYPQVPNQIGKPSLDWRFIADSYYSSRPDYIRTAIYPFNDGSVRYWRDNVPDVPTCFPVQQQCLNSPTPIYRGILLGDLINTNVPGLTSGTYFSNPYIRQQNPYSFEVNLNEAIVVSDREYLIPVKYHTPDTTLAYAFDFDIQYDAENIVVTGFSMDTKIESRGPRLAWTDDAENKTLRSTNYTMGFWDSTGVAYYISVLRYNDEPLVSDDFKDGFGLINGVGARVYVNGTKGRSTNEPGSDVSNNGLIVQVLPNPADDNGNIVFRFTEADPENYIKVVDVLGHELGAYHNLSREGSISLSELSSGVYLVHVFNKATGENRLIKFVRK